MAISTVCHDQRDSAPVRLATRLAFLVAGFAMACWGPLIPYIKLRLSIDPGQVGLLLLSLGLGSVLSMVVAAPLATRWGSRPVILASGVGLLILLPLLTVVGDERTLAVALMLFGAALGALDVAMNIQAIQVEAAAMRPLMSGFHAMFSIGGCVGAGLMTALLSFHASPLQSCLIASALIVLALICAAPHLLATGSNRSAAHFALPRGIVLILAALAGITFLAEGAVLDWGALLMIDKGLTRVEQGGLGYMCFAIAMSAARLTGDALTDRWGDRAMLLWGGIVAAGGFFLLLLAATSALAWMGFVLIGLGAANIVPILFRQAGQQRVMPPGLAVAALTTTGYAGVLCGPAAIGALANHVGLPASFWMLAALFCLVPLCHRVIAKS